MTTKNISDEVSDAHHSDLLSQLDEQVAVRIKNGISEDVSNLAATLIAQNKEKSTQSQFPENITTLTAVRKNSASTMIGEFELLAAAPESSGRLWYEQSITVSAADGSGSYIIELVPFWGDESTVSISVTHSEGDQGTISRLLHSYSGKDVEMSIVANDTPLLKATIKVALDASQADGTGKVLQTQRPPSGSLQVRIDTK